MQKRNSAIAESENHNENTFFENMGDELTGKSVNVYCLLKCFRSIVKQGFVILLKNSVYYQINLPRIFELCAKFMI